MTAWFHFCIFILSGAGIDQHRSNYFCYYSTDKPQRRPRNDDEYW